jgi:hypothetical protein
MADRSQGESALVQFSERLTNSAAFGTLFREGMDLVEETAAPKPRRSTAPSASPTPPKACG